MAGAGDHVRMSPLEIFAGIIFFIIIVAPICGLIGALWELLAESLFK